MSLRDGAVEALDTGEDEGIGVRVRVGGAWGFAACGEVTQAAAEAALQRALEVAAAQPSVKGGELAPEPPARGEHSGPCEEDPFGVTLEDKLELLSAADEALRAQPGIAVARAELSALATEVEFASSEGALFRRRQTECGGGLVATAVGNEGAQVRSWPASHGGSVAQAGFEHVRRLDLAAAAPRVAEEAVALVAAPDCPAGPQTLILAGEQLGLQLHESVGHAVELDRVLGREASYAGTSFAGPHDIGALHYSQELMNVTADATSPGGLGTHRWDDEGVEGQAVPIVREGVLRGFLSSRETAAEIGLERSGGCMRADGFARQPLVRMTNVNLGPGEAGSLEELIADTDSGVLLDTNRSWSIDSRRWQFQFGAETAWEIRGGKLGRLLRNPSYAGITPRFWASMDAVCSASEWRLASVVNCGKGEPGQVARVSHGSAPARFRGVGKIRSVTYGIGDLFGATQIRYIASLRGARRRSARALPPRRQDALRALAEDRPDPRHGPRVLPGEPDEAPSYEANLDLILPPPGKERGLLGRAIRAHDRARRAGAPRVSAADCRALGEGSRRRILDAALDLLAEQGYDGTSLQQVADRVGLHKSSLFHHFRSKDELAREVYTGLVERLLKRLEPLLAEDPPRVETLLAALDAAVDHFAGEPGAARLLMRLMVDPQLGPGSPFDVPGRRRGRRGAGRDPARADARRRVARARARGRRDPRASRCATPS